MPVLETLAIISAIAGGTSQVGGGIAALVGGAKAAEEAKKAQAYQEKWTEKLYEDQMRQQSLQNKLAAEATATSKAAQRFNQELALRNEARTDTDRWYATMQNAANKYADILNRTKSLQVSNAAALQNR
jgi:hypothetical protein